ALPELRPVPRTDGALWNYAIPERLDQALDEDGLGKNRETVADYWRVPWCVRHSEPFLDLQLLLPTTRGGGQTDGERSHPVERHEGCKPNCAFIQWGLGGLCSRTSSNRGATRLRPA